MHSLLGSCLRQCTLYCLRVVWLAARHQITAETVLEVAAGLKQHTFLVIVLAGPETIFFCHMTGLVAVGTCLLIHCPEMAASGSEASCYSMRRNIK
jgi:hypothetical protein